MLDLLYPPGCPFCQEKQWHHEICLSCRQEVPVIESPFCLCCGTSLNSQANSREQAYCQDCSRRKFAFDNGRSLWIHQGRVMSALYLYKYKNCRMYGKIFAREWADKLKQQLMFWDVEVIIPVPIHPKRKRKRGFNQADILATELSNCTGIPYQAHVMHRIRDTKPQKGLSARGRLRNLDGAFGLSRKWQPCSRVLLVDDIYTTGSTLHYMAKLLKKAGVQKVFFLTVSIGQDT